MNDEANLLADVKTQICGDLFIAAAPGVKFQPKRSDALHQRKLDKVMNVFCRRVIAHQRLTLFRRKLSCHRVQRVAQFCCFTCRENSSGSKRRSMSLAGSYLFFEELPVKNNRALPLLELLIQRLAKAAGPHLPGLLFVRHRYIACFLSFH